MEMNQQQDHKFPVELAYVPFFNLALQQNAVPVIDDTIHIADEALFLVEIDRSAHVDFSFVSSFCLVCFPVISLKGMDFHIISVKFKTEPRNLMKCEDTIVRYCLTISRR